MYYTVYKIFNKVNGKIYIGCHKTSNLDDNYMGSGKLLTRAIAKYGLENFEKEYIAIFDNPTDMFNMESTLVNEMFILRDDVYNIKEGGQGGWDFVNKNRLNVHELSAEALQRCREGGLKGSEAAKKLLQDESIRLKVIQKRKETIRKQYSNGRKGTFFGKKHTEETKKKIGFVTSQAQKGTGNSQYGTRWIYSLEEKKSIRIKKDDPLPEGWKEGRKIKF